MEKVIQEDKYGCGAACLAMLTGLTYKEAVRSVYGQDEVDYTTTTEIRLALEKHGIVLSKKRQPFIPGKTKAGLYRAISESKINLTHDADLPLWGGPPVKLESGGYGRPDGLTGTQCRADHQDVARWFPGPVVYSQASYAV